MLGVGGQVEAGPSFFLWLAHAPECGISPANASCPVFHLEDLAFPSEDVFLMFAEKLETPAPSVDM